jgi:TIR domain
MSEEPFKIFVSYRRADAPGYAGWLSYCLEEKYGQENVFRDVAAIDAGVAFMADIEKALRHVDVALCVIGKEWATARDMDGALRLPNPHDPVRLEVEAMLRAGGRRVIPVLVNGAEMPAARELPDELASIAGIYAFEMTDARWRDDLGRLIGLLDNIRAQRGTPRLSGREILRRYRRGESAPTWVGRVGGRKGKAFTSDVRTGRWRRQPYEVQFGGRSSNPNWFSLRQFIQAVDPDDRRTGKKRLAQPTPGVGPRSSSNRAPGVERPPTRPRLTGLEIFERHQLGERGPSWVGRIGGVEGKAFSRDVDTGGWSKQAYEVQFGGRAANRNWFSVQQFVEAVTLRGQGKSRKLKGTDSVHS